MVQAIKKIYVESRFCDPSSSSSTDFRIQLNESILLPDHTAMMVTDICVPHTWYTIEYFNDTLYFRLIDNLTVNSDCVVNIPHKNYDITTLPAAIVAAMNVEARKKWGMNAFTASADETKGTITVSMTLENYGFKIFSNKSLATKVNGTWTGPDYDVSNPQSVNAVLGHETTSEYESGKDYPWVSGFIDVVSIHNIYITSPQFGNNSMGPRGERNILKKVPTTAGFGEIITHLYINEQDLNSCSRKLFQTMEFKVTDSFGNALVLNGGHVSFTLIFVSG